MSRSNRRAAAPRGRGRAGRVRRRDVLGPLHALERAAGPLRLRLVLAGRGAGRPRRCRSAWSTPRAALPPGDHRPGHGTLARCSPAGSGWRWAPVRPPTSTSPATAGRAKDVRNARLRSASRSSGPCCRRGGQPRRSGDRRPGPAVDPAGRPPPLFGAAVSADDRRLGRRLGRRPDHRQPAPRPLREVIDAFRDGGGGGKPLSCRSTCPGPPTRTRRGSPTTSGAPTCSTRRCAGTWTPPSIRRGGRARAAGGRARGGARLRRSGPARRLAAASYVELGFDGIYLHHVGQPSSSAFIDTFGEQVLPKVPAA